MAVQCVRQRVKMKESVLKSVLFPFANVKKCVIIQLVYVALLASITAASCKDVDAQSIESSKTTGPSPEFKRHTLIRPKIYHARRKRQISTTKEQSGEHTQDLTIAYVVDGVDYILDLQLNRELLPKGYFQKYQHQGQHVINHPTGKEAELCQYQGTIRGVANSWAALSTCHNGLTGVIYDGNEFHYLERVTYDVTSALDNNSIDDDDDSGHFDEHFLYKHRDLVEQNRSCGYESRLDVAHHHNVHHLLDGSEINRILRYKRSTNADDRGYVRGPYNANKQSRYLELVIVIDHQSYKAYDENLKVIYTRCKDIANIVNAIYAPLNIFIALVGVVVWTEVDEINISEKGEETLNEFLNYRREKLIKDHPNDNAQLLTRAQFDGGVVGKALKGPICTFEFSGGVSIDHSYTVGLVATTVAHEMGHNFGMEHDTAECNCPEERCIMSPSSSSTQPRYWSSCSLEYLALAFEHGMDYCLRNKPKLLFDSPVCGNGFVEPGEECDCGLLDLCDNPCCNATTCMLNGSAVCATGECCDLTTCRPKKAGSLCRTADHECDLPEYCTGQSEYCPDDIFKMDTETCDNGRAFCYQGSCRTRSDQCKLLWGPSGLSSDDECYSMNIKGTRYGNCGYNRLNQTYIKCHNENVFCGMLHCRHLSERLEFGMESVAILSHNFINSKGSIIPCRAALVDLGLNEIDPGLTPDGAKCGEGKMCVNQKCMPVDSLRMVTLKDSGCPNNCNGNGVCNNKGHCHCKEGYAPPDCQYPGYGGSYDSGPAKDPNAHRGFVAALYLIFLGVVPISSIIFLLVYRRNKPLPWPKSSTKSFKSPTNHHRNNTIPFFCAPNPNPLSASNQDDVSLLPNQPHVTPNATLTTTLFGHFKGFSLTPINRNATGHTSDEREELTRTCHAQVISTVSNSPFIKDKPTPARVAPPIPVVPEIRLPMNRTNASPITHKPVLCVKPNTRKIVDRSSIASGVHLTSDTSITPALPPLNPGSHPRPLISEPILDSSTCTAKELSNCRGGAVVSEKKTTVHFADDVDDKRVILLEEANDQKHAIPVDKPNYIGHATLTRIASFLRNDKPKKDTVNLPKPKTPLDKKALKNIQISAPILQKDIHVTPVVDVATDEPIRKATTVARTQSMRDAKPTSSLQSFGSMRGQNKRPLSIASAHRPTAPPPPAPPRIVPDKNTTAPDAADALNYQNVASEYDDCMRESGVTGVTPLTSQPSSDNIYAVIEESPTTPGKTRVTPVTASVANDTYKTPKSLNATNSGSSESLGLLGEIVTEIQQRNFDSIYSTSTLARKKREQREQIEREKAKEKELYENAPVYKAPESLYSDMSQSKSSDYSTTSSGYINPMAVNIPMKAPDPEKLTAMSSFKAPATDKPFERRASGVDKLPNKKLDDKTPKLLRQTTPPKLNRQTTPPKLGARQKTPPKFGKPIAKPSVGESTHKSLVKSTPKNLPKPAQKPLINGPDVVSSCSTSTSSSPDLLPSRSNVNKVSVNSERKPGVSPKPHVQTKKVSETTRTKTPSNVAQLQKKFEAGK